MFDRPDRRDRDDERRSTRPAPAPQPRLGAGAVLALQRTAGNQAVSRMIARTRKDDEVPLLKLGYAIQGFEQFRALLAATQANWDAYSTDVNLKTRLARDVDPRIARLKELHAAIEREDAPDAKLSEART